MKGYWNRPEETAAQIRDGWLHTGDIGQMHRDGYFRVVDRLKDMIIRSGMNIYPAEVEAVLHEHPKVLEALVIGVPDAVRGELVKAFVVPRDGVEISEEEILAFCRQNLAKYKVPAAVEIRAGLCHSAVGKPLRRVLREELAWCGMSARGRPAPRWSPGVSALVSGATGFLGGHCSPGCGKKDFRSGRSPGRPAMRRPGPRRSRAQRRGCRRPRVAAAGHGGPAAGCSHRRQGLRLGTAPGVLPGQRRRHGERHRGLPRTPGCGGWST